VVKPPVAHLSDPLPVETPRAWLEWIDQPLFDHELTMLRTCLEQQKSRESLLLMNSAMNDFAHHAL
jgi:hypothetical protein